MLKHVRTSESWQKKNLGAKGFTLIELLVVIIILGILAAVVVLAINGIQERGEENACKTEKKTVETAAAAFYADNDEAWPDDMTDIASYVRDPKYTDWVFDSEGVASSATAPCG